MNSFGRKTNKGDSQSVFTKETFGVALIIFATLSLVCLITGSKVFSLPGKYIQGFLLGVFGYFAYILEGILFIFGVKMITGKNLSVFDKKGKVFFVLSGVFAVCLLHAISTNSLTDLSFGDYLTALYKSGFSVDSKASFGGVLYGLIVYWVVSAISFVGSYAVFGLTCALSIYGLVRSTITYNKEGTANNHIKSSYVKDARVDTNSAPVPFNTELSESIDEVKDYPVSGVDFSVQAENKPRQKLFIGEGTEFALKSKREIKRDENFDGLKISSDGNSLGIARTENTYRREYTEEMESKLRYITTPAEIDLSATLGDKYKPKTDDSVKVSKTIPFDKGVKNVGVDIPLYNHDESSQIKTDNVANEITSEANTHAQSFADRYASIDNVDANSDTLKEKINYEPVDKSAFDELKSNDENGREETFDFSLVKDESVEEETEFIEEENKEVVEEKGNTSSVKDFFTKDEGKDTDKVDFFKAFDEKKSTYEQLSFDEKDYEADLEKVAVSQSVKEEPEEVVPINRPYYKPPISLLETYDETARPEPHEERMEIIRKTLESFHIPVTVEDYDQGPTITRYEVKMPIGIQVKKVIGYEDDLRMWLSSKDGVRVEAPIPGKSVVGVEVANEYKTKVGLRACMEGVKAQFKEGSLMFALGKNIIGECIFDDLAKGPHYLVAGTTGSGKSVCLNIMIVSMIMRYSPEELRLILVDPKGNEFIPYEHLPHLVIDEIIKDSKRAISALNWAKQEMDRRYDMLAEAGGIRDIVEYNKMAERNGNIAKMPRIVIIVDELSNLMETNKKEMEARILSIAQKARAVGIHLVLATQRPSVDVITGLIKGNLPSRIALKVTNFADSSTIMGGVGGAEKLLGNGDMLYKNLTMGDYERYQGAFISDNEIYNITKYIKDNNTAYFNKDMAEFLANEEKEDEEEVSNESTVKTSSPSSDGDNLLRFALALGVMTGTISISYLQRRCSIGFARAGATVDKMERAGYVSRGEGAKGRKVLMTREAFIEKYGITPESLDWTEDDKK